MMVWCIMLMVSFEIFFITIARHLISLLDIVWLTRGLLVIICWWLVLVLQCQKQYLVKYHGFAHVHNCWIPETQLVVEAPKLITKFNKKRQV